MTNFIRPIVAVLTIAGTTFALTGCDDWDDFGRLVEGKPTKAQLAAEASPSASLHVASLPPVEVVETAAPVPEKLPCVDPGGRWGRCDGDTLILY